MRSSQAVAEAEAEAEGQSLNFFQVRELFFDCSGT